MTKIFISYRREDTSGYAGRLLERLSSEFGGENVFMDLEDIQPGTDFVEAIQHAVGSSDILIVLIGKRWLMATDSAGRRRIDNPQDFVRIEIESGLARGLRVIPVLVNQTVMPSASEMPETLASLARWQAHELSDTRWDYDIQQLVHALGGSRPFLRRIWDNRWLRIATAAVALAVFAIVFFLNQNRSVSSRSGPQAGVGISPATADVKRATVDVSGSWIAEVTYDWGALHTERFTLTADAGELFGTATFLGVGRGIVQGRIQENTITFVTKTAENLGNETKEVTHSYRGKVVGNEIRFIMQTDGGFSPHPPIQFTARRN
jgi:hypothetical protein